MTTPVDDLPESLPVVDAKLHAMRGQVMDLRELLWRVREYEANQTEAATERQWLLARIDEALR